MVISIYFQEYIAVGIVVMAITGWLFAFFNKRAMYSVGKAISWFPFAFSWLYLVLIAPELQLIIRSLEFNLFFSNPALMNYLLMASLISPIIVSKASRRTLGIAYITYGALIALTLPWSTPRPMILGVTIAAAASLITMGASVESKYLKTVNVDKRVMSLIDEKGVISVEDVMKVLEKPDYEVREILHRLLENDKIDYDNATDRYGPHGCFEKKK